MAACLVSELVNDGFTASDAAALAAWLHAEWPRTAAKLDARLAKLRRRGVGAGGVRLRAAGKAGLVEVVYGDGAAEVALQLSEERLALLRGRYAAASRMDDEAHEGSPRFRRALMALLLRYQSLDGGGFQCALPAPVFACLRREWGVTTEGFASPLNSTLDCFCSAFPDVDAQFGSRGSFFHPCIQPAEEGVGGSFALNPPFSVELYDALFERCDELLTAAEAAHSSLTLVLIIGATEPTLHQPCVARLTASCFLRGRLVVGVGEHVYVCGRQHMKPAAATFRACDTGVFILQTTAAAKRWPARDSKLHALRAAFQATNPGKAS